jgi:hypothetical protein
MLESIKNTDSQNNSTNKRRLIDNSTLFVNCKKRARYGNYKETKLSDFLTQGNVLELFFSWDKHIYVESEQLGG